nr:hypothetical protein [Bacteroidota bacterium]
MKKIALTFICLISIFTIAASYAQTEQGMIYGKVFTEDNETYQGYIRWGTEEAFWFDLFNATKEDNEYIRYLSSHEKRDLEDRNDSENWSLFNIVVNIPNHDNFNHVFVCQFGQIQEINIYRSDRVELTLKNDLTFDLKDGSNDVGARIRVLDEELGLVKLDWDRVERVVFMEPPNTNAKTFGQPLYGTVRSENGEFEGFIQWDTDERLSTDKLDGENRDGDFSIEFGDIKSIIKTFHGSDIVLNSGRELSLRGSNDVDDDNRGIIINMPGFGRVQVEWGEFEAVVFDHSSDVAPPPYEEFKPAVNLAGTITNSRGDSYSGMIAYDLDEAYDFELLHGEYNNMEYLIPFRYIKNIVPKSSRYSQVIMRDGQELKLGTAQDVSEKNYGCIVFENKEDYNYISWDEIASVEFR